MRCDAELPLAFNSLVKWLVVRMIGGDTGWLEPGAKVIAETVAQPSCHIRKQSADIRHISH